jgi:predicted metal-dependent peptidase
MLTSSAKDDYTFKRPSRRFAAQGLCLPSLYSDAMGGLVIGFDTSGSMGPEQCNQVAGEINAIVGDLNPEWVIVVYCDAVGRAPSGSSGVIRSS